MLQDKNVVQLVGADGVAVDEIGNPRQGLGHVPIEVEIGIVLGIGQGNRMQVGVLPVGHLGQVARDHVHDRAAGVGDGVFFDPGLEGFLRLDQHGRQAQDNERKHGRGNEHLQDGQARPPARQTGQHCDGQSCFHKPAGILLV
jgi:hypothetical protein